MNDSFSGVVEIEDKQYAFVFENYYLKIEWDHPFSIDVGDKPWNSIKGSVLNEPYCVIFFLGPVKRTSHKSAGYSSFSIHLTVSFYVVLKADYCGKTLLKFKNKEFAKWLGLYSKHKVELQEDKCEDNIVIYRHLKDQASCFEFQAKHFEILPTVDLSYSPFDFQYMPSLSVHCQDPMNFIDLYKISAIIIDVVRFCFYRKSIDIGDIEICCKENDDSPIGYSMVGTLHINYLRKAIEPIDLNSLVDYGFIPWSILYKYLPSLVSCLEQQNIYHYHFLENKRDRFAVSFSSISSDAAAFEYEFGLLFSNYETVKKHDSNYVELKKRLEDIELRKDLRTILNGFISSYFDYPSLKEKAEYAIKRYKEMLESLLRHLSFSDLSAKQMASYYREGRNSVNHGAKSLKIPLEESKACLVVRAVIICMQLERIGMEKEDIKTSLSFLFDRWVF